MEKLKIVIICILFILLIIISVDSYVTGKANEKEMKRGTDLLLERLNKINSLEKELRECNADLIICKN